MRVEANLPLDNWRAAGPAAEAAEAAGYDGVMVVEVNHDPFTTLAMGALATERVELSTGIALAFPRSPMIVANLAWDLHAHSGGRFFLGLGTQVKGHNERRFSVPWSAPVPRIREFIEALRAIWRCWEQGGEKLDYQGEHYRFSLMTPEWSPKPTGLPMVPIAIAAVGPHMLRLAGRLCDGVRLHPFSTRRYMEEVSLARLTAGLDKSARARANFQIVGGGFIATGPDDEAVDKALDWVRYRIAFYGSTRTYAKVFSLHGLDDLSAKLHQLSAEGKWDQMAAEIPDDLVRLCAAVGTYEVLAGEIEKQLGGIADTVRLEVPDGTDAGVQRELVQDIQRIPFKFEGFKTDW